MKTYSIIAIAAAATLFNGCGIYTKYSRPEDIGADSLFRGAARECADSTRNFGSLGWREVFADACLQRLIDSALVRNTDLRIAQLRAEEAEASLKAARLAYIPSFAFAPEGGLGKFGSGSAQYTYDVPVAASWQIDIFGRLTNAKRRAKALVEGSEAYRRAVRSRVMAGVANSYYTLLMLDAQLEIAADTEENWRENVETMRLLKETGMCNEADVRQSETALYAVQASLHDLREDIFTVENALSALLCEAPHRIERGRLAETHVPERFYTGIPVQMLSNRPDVEYAETSLMQAYYAANEARANLYPSLSLGGSAGWTNDAGTAVVNPGRLLVAAAVSLLQPIFQNGALRARLKIARAQQSEAELLYRQTVVDAGNEVNDAVERCRTARLKGALYAQQVSSLEAAVEKTQMLVQYGSSTYLEVLIARQSLLDARLGVVENSFREIQGMIDLYQALGGGGF